MLSYDGDVWAVDQAVENGRIFAISDIDCFDPLFENNGLFKNNAQLTADTKKWILNWLLDARDNQSMVVDNKDPNLGFGGSPIVSVDAVSYTHLLQTPVMRNSVLQTMNG